MNTALSQISHDMGSHSLYDDRLQAHLRRVSDSQRQCSRGTTRIAASLRRKRIRIT